MLHLNISTFAYKAIHKLSSVCFHNYFTTNSSVHRIGNRQSTRGDLFLPLKKTTLYGLQTIQYFGSKLWNTLPLFIRVAGSISLFRSKLKAILTRMSSLSISLPPHYQDPSFPWGTSSSLFFLLYKYVMFFLQFL